MSKKINLTLFVSLFVLLSNIAFSQSLVINVSASGNSSSGCYVSFSAVDYTFLGDLTAGINDEQIASVTEACDNPDGYMITITSSYRGLYNGDTLIPYVLKYGGTTVTGLTETPTVLTNSSASSSATTKTMTISVIGSKTFQPGSYSDILTLSITSL